MRDLLRESAILLALRHRHIVSCYGVIIDELHVGLVTELMDVSVWDAMHKVCYFLFYFLVSFCFILLLNEIFIFGI